MIAIGGVRHGAVLECEEEMWCSSLTCEESCGSWSDVVLRWLLVSVRYI